MQKNHYVSGSFNVICDVCGQKHKANNIKKRWDGLMVCPDDYEERHPQDFVKARQDKITVPFTRPRPPDVFVPNNFTEPVLDSVYIFDDVLDIIINYYRTVDDVVVFTDEVNINIESHLTDTVTTTENISTLILRNVDVTDTVTITDEVTPLPNVMTTINGSVINGEIL